jgi:hypothetical protein
MFTSEAKELTDLSPLFLGTGQYYPPAVRSTLRLLRRSPPQLRGSEAARRFSYVPGNFRVLVHQLRQNPRRDFFLKPVKRLQAIGHKNYLFVGSDRGGRTVATLYSLVIKLTL